MKRFICLLAAMFLLQGMVFSDYSGDTESLIPEDAGIFIKTREISHLLKTANYILSTLDDENKKSFNKKREEFRSKTSIDYLKNESLKKIGIDTARPISFVSFDKDNNQDVMAFLVPIINEKDFPLKFIEIIKKIRPDEELDVYPVITDYNGSALYQIQKDIFTATVSGYFVIASTGDLVKKILDRQNDRKGSLILNKDYSDYLSKRNKVFDINIFLSREFIKRAVDSISEKDRFVFLNTIEEEREFLYLHKVKMDTSVNASNDKAKNDFDTEIYDAIEYLSGGIGFSGNKLQISGSVKLNSNSWYSKAVSGLFKTGLAGRMLYMPEVDLSLFLSYNLQSLKDLCSKNEPWCKAYDDIKQGFKSETGVDFEEEFLPAYSGAATVVYTQPEDTTEEGSLALFLSMNSELSTKNIWSKLKKHLSIKYSDAGKFEEAKYKSGSDGFWFEDKSGSAIHIVYNAKGIYIGTSREFVIKAMEGTTFNNAKNPGRLGRFLNSDTYLIFHLKNGDLLKSLAADRYMDDNLYSGPLSRLGEIFIYCEKKGSYYSIDFDIEFQ